MNKLKWEFRFRDNKIVSALGKIDTGLELVYFQVKPFRDEHMTLSAHGMMLKLMPIETGFIEGIQYCEAVYQHLSKGRRLTAQWIRELAAEMHGSVDKSVPNHQHNYGFMGWIQGKFPAGK